MIFQFIPDLIDRSWSFGLHRNATNKMSFVQLDQIATASRVYDSLALSLSYFKDTLQVLVLHVQTVPGLETPR